MRNKAVCHICFLLNVSTAVNGTHMLFLINCVLCKSKKYAKIRNLNNQNLKVPFLMIIFKCVLLGGNKPNATIFK